MPEIIPVGEADASKRGREFTMRSATDGSIMSGQAANITVQVRVGGVSAAATGTVTEPDAVKFPGLYVYTLGAGEVAAVGSGWFRPTLTGAVVADYPFTICANDFYEPEASPADVRTEMDTNSTALAAIQSTQTSLTSTVSDVQSRTALIPDAPAAVGSAMALTADERQAAANALLDMAAAIDGKSVREFLRILGAFYFGAGHGFGTDTPTFDAMDGSKTRVTGHLGDPTARTVTLDPS